LAVSYPNLPIVSQFYLKTYPDDSRIIIQKSEKNLTASEFEIQQTIRESRSKVVTIFKKKNDNSKDPLSQVYRMEETKGSGIILTNDGLVITSQQVVDDLNSEYVAVTSDQNIYSVANIQSDPMSNSVFFRINATNLAMAEFVDPADLKAGQRLISFINKIDGSSEVMFTELGDLHYIFPEEEISSYIFSSESFDEQFLLTSPLPDKFKGAPLLALDGKIVGIAYQSDPVLTKADSVIPDQQFRSIIPRLLKNGTMERAWLGIHYLDLSRIINVPENLSRGLNQGALIYGDDTLNLPAVINQSPADQAGLKTGDLITKINETEINLDNPLPKVLQEYEPGEEIELVVMRDNQEIKQKITLEKLPE